MNTRLRFLSVILALTVCLLAVTPTFAQRGLKDIPDPDAEKQRQSFKLDDGLEVTLFASDPWIANPIHMNWDSAGRLWVATSPIYPMIKPGQKATDKIVVLRDTDGDGKADKHTVFADNLLIPTAVLPGDPSKPGNLAAYVANSTEMLHLEDTDGDGKADKTRVVLSGFGTEDTHHILHTFRWGPDGRMYFNQSIYIHSHIETPWGIRRLDAGGIWQFRTESQRLEVYARGFVNTWGHVFDEWGQSFATDGAFGEGINYVFPDAAFVAAKNVKRTLRGLNPGQPKHCSLARISGRHFPEDWRGSLVTNDFRGNRTNRFVLGEAGSGYSSRKTDDVVQTKHVAYRPIDVKMGPDGALYIADFYNPIIQHGEVDFRDPRRDTKHGRIWRVTYKGRPLVEKPRLMGASIGQLLDYLKAPEQWTRHHAKRQLKERYDLGTTEQRSAIIKQTLAWLDALNADSATGKGDGEDPMPIAERHRLEGLWVLQQVNAHHAGTLMRVFESKEPRARAAAVRVLHEWHEKPGFKGFTMRVLREAIGDEHPRVRLEAVHTLRAIGTAEAVEVAMRAVDKPIDTNLDYALWVTANNLQSTWLPAYVKGELTFDGKVNRTVFALTASGNAAAVKPLIAALKAGKVGGGDVPAVLGVAAAIGGPGELAELFAMARQPAGDHGGKGGSKHAGPILDALLKAADRKARPGGDLSGIQALMASDDAAISAKAMRLAGRWRVKAAESTLIELASKDGPKRDAAIDALAAMGTASAKQTLTTLSGADKPLPLRQRVVLALVKADLKLAAKQGGALLQSIKVGGDVSPADVSNLAGPVFAAFYQQRQGPGELNKFIAGQRLPAAVATVGIQRAGTSGRKLDWFVKSLMKAGNLSPMQQKLTPKQMAALITEVNTSGNPARGETVYHRKVLACTNCHAIAGGGGLVGPDMVSLGASAPMDYIIESLLEPNKKIKEGYHMSVVSTKSFDVYSGVVLKETEDAIEMRDATGRAITIPKANIEERKIQPTSMMPAGLTAGLRRDEFIDLVAFLAQLGKDGPFKAPKERYVRRWQVLTRTKDVERRLRATSSALALTDDPSLLWEPRYSRVSGEVPMSDVVMLRRFAGNAYGFLRFDLEVNVPGKVAMRFNDPTGVELWVGKKKVDVSKTTTVDLSAGDRGRVPVTLAITMADRNAPSRETPMRIELVDVPGSKAQVELVGGP